jgi:capsular polysaccharide export protein
MALAINPTIARIPHLATLLADHPRAVAGWGRKPSGRRAERVARLLGRAPLWLEDGFLRSVERSAPTLSLIVDDLGVYYDAARPSRMEALIAQGVRGEAARRAEAIAERWRTGRVSKYNHAPDYAAPLPARYVLVVDQTWGDLAITCGQADAASFRAMLNAALAEQPDADILVKIHPDVLAGRRRGHFSPADLADPRITIIAEDCHAPSLLRGAETVYAVTSLMGFEALLWDRRVRCFGMPFYAGWGLTEDELPAPPRRGRADRPALVHAALVALTRYADPGSGEPWSCEEAIDYIAAARGRIGQDH